MNASLCWVERRVWDKVYLVRGAGAQAASEQQTRLHQRDVVVLHKEDSQPIAQYQLRSRDPAFYAQHGGSVMCHWCSGVKAWNARPGVQQYLRRASHD